jgi:plastocyanin domain-containing protein
MRFAAILLALLAVASCEKSKGHGKTQAQGTVGADGVRRIPIEAGQNGYDPDAIHAKAGEKLILVFRRTAAGECLSKVKVADGPLTELPMNKDVEIPVTAPASGELAFVCGMDGMQSGVIAVE